MFGGTAQKPNVAIRAGSVGDGCISLIVSRSPRADTPATERARPERYAAAPTMSSTFEPWA